MPCIFNNRSISREDAHEFAAAAVLTEQPPRLIGGRCFVKSGQERAFAASATIEQHGDTNCLGHQVMQEPQSLGHHFLGEKIDAGRVADRPGEARDKTKLDRVLTDAEHGIVLVAALAASPTTVVPGVAMTATRRRTRSAISAGGRSY